MFGNIPIDALAKLKAIYKSEYEIYLATISPSNFRSTLIENNILIPKETFRNMIDVKLKEYSLKVSDLLKYNNIEQIGVLEKEYPKSLRKLYNCPTAIYIKQNKNKEKVDNKAIKEIFTNMYKVYMLEDKNEFNKEILEYIWSKTISKKQRKYITSIVKHFEITDKKIIKFGLTEYIGICLVGDIEIYVLKKENMDIDKKKIILDLIDGLIIARITNIEEAMNIVDYLLEEGKDIFAVPGNILYKENYLANHIIKQGAYIVTNRYDMKNLV